MVDIGQKMVPVPAKTGAHGGPSLFGLAQFLKPAEKLGYSEFGRQPPKVLSN